MTKIQVTPAIDSMAKGNAQQLTATGIYSDHSTVDITNSVNWISTNTNNVEVNKVGLASGKGVGAASITAEKEGITSNAGTMKVTNAVLTSIQVTAEMARMPKGVVQQLTATGSYSDGTTANITAQVSWLSTATSQIKVNTKGIAIAGAEGKSTITAKQGDITSNKMTLTSTAAELTDIQVTPAKAQVANGETLQLKAMGTFSDNSTVDVTDRVAWHSSRAGVVTIMTNGIVTGGGEGDVTVSAADDGVNSKEVIITVTAAVLTEIQVTPAKFSVAKGHAQQLIAIGTYSDKTTADISDSVDWQSTDTANVTVSAKGMISGVNKGDSIITAGKNTITSNKTTITVTSAVLMKVLVTPIDSIVAKGNSQQLKAEGSYSDQSVVDISSIVAWHSNDSDSVTISSTGLAKGVDIGSTTITAMKDEINSNAAKINVTDALLMQIQVTPAQSIVAKGNTQQLTAIGTYTDNSTVDITKAVSWHSSEVDQLTVSDQGVATGVDIGMPTVTASKGDIGSLPASVQVTSAALQKIQVTPVQSSVAKGNTQKFIAMGTYSDKSTVDISDSVSWHSSSTSEVTISATGMAEGVGEGKSDITANKNAIGSNTASMRVTPAVLVTIQVTPAAATVVEGATQQLTATGIYSDDTTADISDRVSWHSTETDNVTVTAKGLASGVGVGSSTITATLGEVTSNDEKMTVSKAVLAHIQVTPASFSLAKGNTQQLSATGVYNNGTTFEITDSVDWHSLNLAEVTVNKTGLAAGMNKGVAQVTATKGSITSSQVTINVTDAVLTDIQITPANISIAQGNTQQLKAIGTYSDDSSKDITESVSWQTGNIDTVTLSALGIATGESTGKTTITAVKDKKTSNVANIEVTSAELTDIQITPAQSTLAKGNTQQLVATGIYSNDTVVVITGSVSWKSSSTDDVTVTPKGLATGVNEGKVTISATKGGVRSKHTATIQVSAAVLTSIQVTPPLTHVAMGNTQQLTAMGIYSDKSSADISDSVSWHAEDIEKVTMSATGLATGVDTGSTAITAIKDTHTSNEVTVEVTDALLTQIQVTPKQSSVAKGNTQQLTATGTYSDKTTKDISENVTWKSYDTSFATVSDKGLATGVGVGDATITAATTALTSESVSMHVTAAVLESIEVTPAAPTVTKTKTQQFRAMGTYNDKAIEDITTSVDWHSSAIDIFV